MFSVAVGHSPDPDSCVAIREVMAQCQETLDEHRPQVGILLSAMGFDHKVILYFAQEVRVMAETYQVRGLKAILGVK